MNCKAALFDMDGTLLHSEYVAIPAYKAAFIELQQAGIYSGPVPAEENLLAQLGKTLDKIWEELLPDSTRQVRYKADEIMLKKEIELIKDGKSVFYPGVKETLTDLKKHGYDIFVVSNGLEDYIAALVEHSGFKDLFTDLYSAGRFKTKTKGDLVKKLLQDYPFYNKIYMIGDRSSDIESGRLNNLTTVGCLFGYGSLNELRDADYLVESFEAIKTLLL